MQLTNQRWQAIVTNDKTFDGHFFYGVMSTGIFCRPSCRSRCPNRRNVQLFARAADALAAGLRPCKRCRPTGAVVTADEWVHEIDTIIQHHFAESLTLNELALRAHGAPSYLRRVYREQTGQTPQVTLERVRLNHARILLATTTSSIQAVALACGFQSAGYFSTRFKRAYRLSPRVYRQSK